MPPGFSNSVKNALQQVGNNDDEVSVILCNDSHIRRLNRDFLNQDKTTDVLSFDLSDPQANQIVGEIYINLDRVRKQAMEFGVSFWNELVRLTIHGILHLYDYDDSDPISRGKMIAKQEEMLAKCHHHLHC
ncbi:hypothetical protein AMJ86_02310 [bacterium SM23_57]|nr:MAG: hypothetical protein AMJ86_02310 [bacterium SM23_57]